MPVVGEPRDRIADLVEELCDHLQGLSQTEPPPAPVVNVAAPNVHVAAPSVTVEALAKTQPSWLFTVSRDAEGRISSIIANPT